MISRCPGGVMLAQHSQSESSADNACGAGSVALHRSSGSLKLPPRTLHGARLVSSGLNAHAFSYPTIFLVRFAFIATGAPPTKCSKDRAAPAALYRSR